MYGRDVRVQSFAKACTFPRAPISASRKISPERLARALAFRLIATEIDLSFSLSLARIAGTMNTYSRTRASSEVYLVGTGNHVTADAVNVLNTAWGVECRYI